MLIVSGTLHVDPAERERYLDACRAAVARARSTPGCLDFALSADLLDPGRINVYERWSSDEDLLRFRGSGPEPGTLPEIRAADVAKHRIAATEPP
ncbi:antibiotic biosynthesis monooxygenase [Prauserella shujinwangii]|uniref:Antibiotic biosynthesis monooxygenase n=1 Tax=Prauserella shujinwangii TaxID=1453103 RepID=A0A2T0LKL8_9PSEU|nr:antibiotic biosynthesis monooxygenase family protein [Prauserella shujinwangii]PRX43437.1 antibiotic biosynthesis monooxygenase [Prauserella shujinwangii]